MVGLVLRSLTRRRLRTLLVVGAVALAVAGFVSLSGLARGYLATWGVLHAEHGSEVVAFESGVVELMSSRLPPGLAERVRAADGVASASPMLTRVLEVSGSRHSLLVTGAAPDAKIWQNLELYAGRPPGPDARAEIVLGEQAAVILDRQVGDSLDLRGHAVEVVGIASFTGAANKRGGFMHLGPLQRLTGRPGSITYLSIELAPEASLDALLAALNRDFPAARFYPGRSVAGEIRLNQVFVLVVHAIAGIALLVAVLCVVDSLAVAVAESKHDHAVLIALGWPRWRIAALVLTQSLVFSTLGALLGTLTGAGVLLLMTAHPLLSAFVEFDLDAADLAVTVVVICLLGTLGSLAPALRAVAQDTARVLSRP